MLHSIKIKATKIPHKMALSRPVRDAIISIAAIVALVAAFILWVKWNRVKRQGRVDQAIRWGRGEARMS